MNARLTLVLALGPGEAPTRRVAIDDARQRQIAPLRQSVRPAAVAGGAGVR